MDLKKEVAEYVTKFVNDGDVVGLGTGSTCKFFIEKLGQRVKEENLDILGVVTSYQAFFLAKELGIPITSLEEQDVDIAVDGADAIDPNLDIIKGGGASHTLEKIIDYSAKKFYVIADESKYFNNLSECAVPIEVIPIASRSVINTLTEIGATPEIRIGVSKQGPVITDNGNFVIDAKFADIPDPSSLEKDLNTIPGVVENGLFTKNVDDVFISSKDGIKKL
ncbi:ribose-5-phosphate isomerase RpiA [Methanobrevibacter sp. DSM 116169]|uniref:ribose-5-phosphate isomerase RpiA n=1 Tax=Methanobrevibacter sp. DSM 116169 TaxID=3242727 RepID=UPI0038FC400B